MPVSVARPGGPHYPLGAAVIREARRVASALSFESPSGREAYGLALSAGPVRPECRSTTEWADGTEVRLLNERALAIWEAIWDRTMKHDCATARTILGPERAIDSLSM